MRINDYPYKEDENTALLSLWSSGFRHETIVWNAVMCNLRHRKVSARGLES